MRTESLVRVLDGGVKIDRVYENSALRRGRLATSPVWYVTLVTGTRWRFNRKRDADAFAAAGGCTNHETFLCRACGGRQLL